MNAVSYKQFLNLTACFGYPILLSNGMDAVPYWMLALVNGMDAVNCKQLQRMLRAIINLGM